MTELAPPHVHDNPSRTEPMTRVRKVIATRMLESLAVSAQLTTVFEVDLTKVAELRNLIKNDFAMQNGVKLSYLPFVARAALEALKEHPLLNASVDIEKGEITYFEKQHLAVAVDTDRGLLVPVVRDAGDLTISELARSIDDLARRCRERSIKPDELAGGTFTISNTGSRGALFDTPIINQPQVAILGFGAVVRRPVAMTDAAGKDHVAIRALSHLALTYDHRVIDGADASRFLSAIKVRLEEASFVL